MKYDYNGFSTEPVNDSLISIGFNHMRNTVQDSEIIKNMNL